MGIFLNACHLFWSHFPCPVTSISISISKRTKPSDRGGISSAEGLDCD